jgi:hypothetical protein
VELNGRRRHDARPWLAKMYKVPPTRAWWHAVGAPLERKVMRSPADATGAWWPQAPRTEGLHADYEGVGSPETQ